MKTYFFVILFFLQAAFIFSQDDKIHTFGEESTEAEYFFGFNLIPSGVGGLNHFVLIKPLANGEFNVIQITKERFINQAEGKQESLANPKNINFFEEFNIQNTLVVNDLWKLRYIDYPYFTMEKMDNGWSSNDSIPFLPTNAQMQILNKFGMTRLSDYIYGENAFQLLFKMTSDKWVKEYKESY
ncbi:MAG: hypothetical protein JXR51_02125 [Bacteroidales bacterium]|nr:hypothetical protein [Bacteroidales bacterium]MBN2755944.1 hypothetical protein [Bacteroidales bacterium]